MEGDAKALLTVVAWMAASMTYARFASISIGPGKLRLFSLLPVIVLLLVLPCYFFAITLRGFSAFFLVWLATFKLLLLSFSIGPLSPSLSLGAFLAISSLPVNLRSKETPTPLNLTTNLLKLALFPLLAGISLTKSQLHPYLLQLNYCLFLYISVDLILAAMSLLVRVLFNLELDPQFNAPLMSNSLKDFWGKRWNLMVTGILRPSVYLPVRSCLGHAAGVLVTFLVSGVMHEILLFYVTNVRPSGEMLVFFSLHGVCVVAESLARRSGWWQPHPLLAVPLAVGFVAVTAFWLFWPPILRNRLDERYLEDVVAVWQFLEEGGRSLASRLTGIW